MNHRSRTPLSLVVLFFFVSLLEGAPFVRSLGINAFYPSPGENVVRDNLLAVDAQGDHHFVSLTGTLTGPEVYLVYEQERGNLTRLLDLPAGGTTQRLQAMTTTASGDVLLITYLIGDSSRGCVLYHLNGPNPTEGRLILPTTSTPGAVVAPMEDGSVLLATCDASQVIIGRLSPGAYEYAEMGRFGATVGSSSQEFSALSAFVEQDQTIHLAASTREAADGGGYLSQLIYRRFEFNNLAIASPWEIVDSAVSALSGEAVADHHAIAVTNETVIVYADRDSGKLRSARKTPSGWEFQTLVSSANIGKLFIAPDELGTLTAAWDNLSNASSSYRTLTDNVWGVSENLSIANFTSFATDRGGYLHFAGPIAVELPGGEIRNGYVSYRPKDVTDLDGDGLPYVLEEVLGTDPDVPNPQALTFGMSASSMASLSCLVTGDLARVNTSDSYFYSAEKEIALEVQYSTNLSFWREAVVEVDTDLFQISGRPPVFVTTLRESALATPRAFLRLKATRKR
ncbi:hypothetical protein [Roseibacillus persicicus]|uniref:Uncharacterized protein n=1 Tax=Roseibacillus persicicus TaxID=454148 RepID=A0A918TF42_9BACT|nr:hypothetical protein [Roseibacillus persicicus]GHC42052.1 hypothetical protein GCM10007100_03710 [Roseibacillus persicicus]